MSLAKIVAVLVERGEEDLASDLVEAAKRWGVNDKGVIDLTEVSDDTAGPEQKSAEVKLFKKYKGWNKAKVRQLAKKLKDKNPDAAKMASTQPEFFLSRIEKLDELVKLAESAVAEDREIDAALDEAVASALDKAKKKGEWNLVLHTGPFHKGWQASVVNPKGGSSSTTTKYKSAGAAIVAQTRMLLGNNAEKVWVIEAELVDEEYNVKKSYWLTQKDGKYAKASLEDHEIDAELDEATAAPADKLMKDALNFRKKMTAFKKEAAKLEIAASRAPDDQFDFPSVLGSYMSELVRALEKADDLFQRMDRGEY